MKLKTTTKYMIELTDEEINKLYKALDVPAREIGDYEILKELRALLFPVGPGIR